MNINWPLVAILFFFSLPGICLTIPRLIRFLLPSNTSVLIHRVSKIAVIQTALMVFLLILAGTALSTYTQLDAPILKKILTQQLLFSDVQERLLDVFIYTVIGFLVYLVLYYKIILAYLDEKTIHVMKNMRAAIGLDGCMLFGGVVEELIARWGIMNLTAFFIFLFTQQLSPYLIGASMILSGLFLSIGQLPAYYAAGCHYGRRFVYALVSLNVCQALLFGMIFWHYGLLSAIISHMLFHLAWWLYDKP